MKLRTLLLLTIVPTTVGLTLFLEGWHQRSLQQSALEATQADLTATSLEVVDQLDTFLSIPQSLITLNRNALEQDYISLNDWPTLERYFQDQVQAFGSITSLSFANTQGAVVGAGRDQFGIIDRPGAIVVWESRAETNYTRRFYHPWRQGQSAADIEDTGPRPILHETPNFKPQDTLYYQTALQRQRQTWTAVARDAKLPIALISAVTPLYRSGEFQGVLHSDILLSDLTLFLQTISAPDPSEVVIVERSGTAIASSFALDADKANANAFSPLAQSIIRSLQQQYPHLNQLQTPLFLTLSLDSRPHGVQVSPYRDEYGLDWLVVTTMPLAGVQSRWGQSPWMVLGVGALTLLVVGGLSYGIAQRVDQPLAAVQASLRSLLQHQVPPPIADQSPLSLIQGLIEDTNALGVQIAQTWSQSQGQEQRSVLILENLPVGLGLWDGTGQLLFLNQQGRQLLGLEPTTVLGREHSPPRSTLSFPTQLPPLFYTPEQTTPLSLQQLPGFGLTTHPTPQVLRNVEVLDSQGHRVPLTIKMQWVTATAAQMATLFPSPTLDSATPSPPPPASDPGDPQQLYQLAIFENTTFQRQLDQLQQTHQDEVYQQLSTLQQSHNATQTLLQNLLKQVQVCVVQLKMDCQYRVTIRSVSPQSQAILGYSPEALQADPQLWYQNIDPDDRAKLIDPHLRPEAWCVPGSAAHPEPPATDRVPVPAPSTAPSALDLLAFHTLSPDKGYSPQFQPPSAALDTTTPASYRFRRPDGSQCWLVSRYSSQWNSHTEHWSVMVFSWDVTPFKGELPATLQQLHQAKEKAEQESRSKSEFLATMSHDLRTPLSGVVGMVDLALKTELTSQQHHYLDRIQSASKTLLALLNDLLDLSKIEAGQFALEEVVFSLEEVVINLSDLKVLKDNHKALELIVDLASNVPPYLKGDPLRLSQILTNLVSNALKFTEEGEVVVSAETLESTDQSLTIQFSVRDTGIGLTVEQQERLFEAFQQAEVATARKYGGTGLGLYICNRLVAMMGGSLGVDSEPGRGSLFWFTTVLGKVDPKDYPQPAETIHALAGLRILVVDDSPLAAQVLRKLLVSYGAMPTVVASGRQAIASLTTAQTQQQPFDIMLLDQRMPEMDGLEVADYLQRHPSLQSQSVVIMMTGYSLQEVSNQANALGIPYLLSKPIQGPKLLATILAAIGDRRELPPSLPATAIGAATPAPPVLSPPSPPNPIRSNPVLSDPEHSDLSGATTNHPILLVEDNPINQELTLALLEQINLGADVASDGAQALRRLRQKNYELVLMDCQMPVMDGFEATIQIRQNPRWQHLPIVALTANVLRGDRERCLAVGMNDYLPKPIDSHKFKAMLRRWLPQAETQAALGDATTLPPPELTGTELTGTELTGTELTVVTNPAPSPAPPDQPAPHSRPEAAPRDPSRSSEFQDLTRANLTLALDHLGHNNTLYRKLLHRFLDRYLTFAETFQRYQTNIAKDPLGPTRFAHTLKSNAATLGFEALQGRAYDLEQVCRSLAIQLTQTPNQAEPTIAEMNDALAAVIAELEPTLAEVQCWADREAEPEADSTPV